MPDMPRADLPGLVFMWEQFGAYHVDRLKAVAAALGDRYRVVGIEVAATSLTYAWKPVDSGDLFRRHTLFPDAKAEQVPWREKMRSFFRVLAQYSPAGVFLCNQEHPEILAICARLRARRIPTYAMLDAKFDDSPRQVLKEAAKQLVLRLYRGGLVAGRRHLEYYRFLGLPAGWAVTAYDTVSIERVRSQAGRELAPGGKPHGSRDFVVVARFVPKKNIQTAIRAYARFRRLCPDATQRLLLCGSGELEPMIRVLIAELGVEGVELCGFVDDRTVAATLADAMALILPSVEEQWGLVVNEAVALGIPVLCSDNVGARDTLVRTGVNGFVVEPDNDEGLAACMALLAQDPILWRRMSLASHAIAPKGDVGEFVRGVSELIGIRPRTPDGVAGGVHAG